MAIFIKLKEKKENGYYTIEQLATRMNMQFEMCNHYPIDLLSKPNKYLFNPKSCSFIANPDYVEPEPETEDFI